MTNKKIKKVFIKDHVAKYILDKLINIFKDEFNHDCMLYIMRNLYYSNNYTQTDINYIIEYLYTHEDLKSIYTYNDKERNLYYKNSEFNVDIVESLTYYEIECGGVFKYNNNIIKVHISNMDKLGCLLFIVKNIEFTS